MSYERPAALPIARALVDSIRTSDDGNVVKSDWPDCSGRSKKIFVLDARPHSWSRIGIADAKRWRGMQAHKLIRLHGPIS